MLYKIGSWVWGKVSFISINKVMVTNSSLNMTVLSCFKKCRFDPQCLTINHADETFSSMDSLVAESNSDLLRLNSIHGDSREEMNLHNPDADPNKKVTLPDSVSNCCYFNIGPTVLLVF